MKRLLFLVLLFFVPTVHAQTYVGGGVVTFSGTAPTVTCGAGLGSGTWSTNTLAINVTTGAMYTCVAGTWTSVGAPGPGVPSGALIAIASGTCPSGFTENDSLAGVTVVGTTSGAGNVGNTGGSSSYTPAGTNSTPTFSGAVDTTSAVSAGTPAGTNSSGGFSEGAISWPAGVPTNASGAFTEGALSWPAGVPTAASITAGTPAGTNSGAAFSVTTAEYGSGTTAYVATHMGGTTLASGTTSITLSTQPTFAGSALAVHTHTISWPAGVPTIAAGSFTQPTVSWPAGVPTIASGSFTQPTFAGNALATHTHTLTPTGTVSTPSFSGTPATITPPYILVIWCSKT